MLVPRRTFIVDVPVMLSVLSGFIGRVRSADRSTQGSANNRALTAADLVAYGGACSPSNTAANGCVQRGTVCVRVNDHHCKYQSEVTLFHGGISL
jgi:hypothetical protein